MRILLLSFYYPPDIGPGPLRAKSIVDALLDTMPSNVSIDVMTTRPNRYQSMSTEDNDLAGVNENDILIKVKRFHLPKHASGLIDQSWAFLAFVKAVIKATHLQKYDVVVATSSRLMTAVLGAWIAKRTNAKLYLDIRDLFTDTINDVFVRSPLKMLLPIFRLLEAWAFKSAIKINLVSAGFLPHVKKVAPLVKTSVLTNGIDDSFLSVQFMPKKENNKPLVMYAGNIGEGQGLHRIVPSAAKLTREQIDFTIIGDGGQRLKLKDGLTQLKIENVKILDPVSRNQLIEHYRKADILFLHLNDHKAFHKVLPSKIFEYAATNKPILAGVSGYAAFFLKKNVPGVYVFEPCDFEEMNQGIFTLINGPKYIDRTYFCSQYRRKLIMKKLALDVLRLSDAI